MRVEGDVPHYPKGVHAMEVVLLISLLDIRKRIEGTHLDKPATFA